MTQPRITGGPIRLIFAGSGAFGVPTLKRLVAEPAFRVVQVVTQPDRAAGRGRRLTGTPIAQAAAELGLPVLRTNDINAESLPKADLLVVIAFGQKVGPALAGAFSESAPRLGAINLHASLLPRHRGAAPIQHAILAGDQGTGNSIIRLAQKMDAGAVLAQSSLAIGEIETAGELHDRLAADGAALMLQTIAALAEGSAREEPQDDSRATQAPKLSAEAGRIDFTKAADHVARQIRAMWPWPGCRVQVIDPTTAKPGAPTAPAADAFSLADAIRVASHGQGPGGATLARARALDGPTGAQTGTINEQGHVVAGDGRVVEVIELQPQGGRLMKLADYANGRPWRAGMQVRSIG